MENLTCVDLFAGASGLSEGFVRKGFVPVAHIEKDLNACLTIKTRIAYHYLRSKKLLLYRLYLEGKITRDRLYSIIPAYMLNTVINQELTRDNYSSIIRRINENLHYFDFNKIDVLTGGPPCQLYSVIGRAKVGRNIDKKTDSRYNLYQLYSKLLKIIKPRVFVFENVPGLLSSDGGRLRKRVEYHFTKAGYDFDCRILNAYDFGVLQQRRRVIFIGWEKGLGFECPEFGKCKKNGWRVWDVFEDLPPLKPGENLIPQKNIDIPSKYQKNPSKYLKELKIRTDEDVLINHVTRNHNQRDRKIYKLAIRKWMKEKRRLMYTDVPLKYQTHRNLSSFLDRYKVVAGDLPYSQTVVAHISKDGHYYIHPDINQTRSISVREAARLQSFQDNHFFEGPMISKFRQIGNAVPPLMAEKIAIKIRKMLT